MAAGFAMKAIIIITSPSSAADDLICKSSNNGTPQHKNYNPVYTAQNANYIVLIVIITILF